MSSPSLRPLLPALASAALVAVACSETDVAGVSPLPTDAAVRVVNATQSPLDVLVDGAVALRGLPVASVSEKLPVAAGARVVQLRTGTGATVELSVAAVTGQALTAAAVAGATGGLAAQVLADTGAIVPAGRSKLRVSHLAASGASAVEIFRTQPDFQTPVRIMTPFAYRATSPYLQGDPGAWEVFVAPAGSSGSPKVATTGPLVVPSGERRTVVLLDSAGVLRFRVIQE